MTGHTNEIRDRIPTVLLPIETVARELDSKLLVASGLAGAGLRAIVGHKEAIKFIGSNSASLIWQGKNLFSDNNNDHIADRLIRNGSSIMYLQDEGGMFQVSSWKENVIQKHHMDQLKTRPIDRLCVWGSKQADVLSSFAPSMRKSIVVTGTPRFDVCAEDYEWVDRSEVTQLTELHGRYILVCTRFGSIAHADGIHDAFRRKLNPRIWPGSMKMKEIADIWFTKWHRDVYDFADFCMFIRSLALEHPNMKIVLRPHPSESLAFYNHAFSHLDNIQVIREGAVMKWIRGAEFVIHSNCTTGIEAILAGKPVLNFMPGDSDRTELDVEVAREAGVVARSVPEALEFVTKIMRREIPKHVWSDEAMSVLSNLSSPALPSLVAETLAVVADRNIQGGAVVLPPTKGVRRFLKRVVGLPEEKRQAYIASKRGPLSLSYVENFLKGCRAGGHGKGRIRVATGHYVVVDPT